MQFDPKIFNSPDSDLDGMSSELELPEDLEALADQLREDAKYLSQQHPAILAEGRQGFSSNTSAAASLTGSDRSAAFFFGHRRWLFSSVAAASVVLMIVWGNQSQPHQDKTPSQQVVKQPDPGLYVGSLPSHVPITPLSESSNVDSETIISRQPLYSDASFLRQFSDPQLEAILDMLDHQKVEIHPVSF